MCTTTHRRWLGLTAAHDEGNEDVKSAAEFQALAGSAALAMGEWGAARALALSWLDALATWVEVTELWPAIEDKATVRMEEVRGVHWKGEVEGQLASSMTNMAHT